MSENLPEFLPQRKKGKADWRKHFELVKGIHEIERTTPPGEAWSRIIAHNDYLENHPIMTPQVQNAQREFMKRSGLNPDEWIYYRSTQPENTKEMVFTEEDMAKNTANFPDGFEFFATPGELVPFQDSKTGETNMYISENYWAIYIRRRNDPQITS